MPFTDQDQRELSKTAIDGWWSKYRDLFSCYQVDGEDGLRQLLAAWLAQEPEYTQGILTLAANSLSEKQVMQALRINPDINLPNYDKNYMDLFQKILSKGYLELQNRGALESIMLLEEFSPLAEKQYLALIEEANGPKKAAAQASATPLEDWVRAYEKTPTEWLRKPAGGIVRMKFDDGVREIPVATFNAQLNKAIAAGKV
jgi:hypothetical protein